MDFENINKMPYSIDAERALIGGLFINTDIFGQVSEIVRHKDFYSDIHADIFRAMYECYINGKGIDVVIVEYQLKKFTKLKLEDLSETLMDICGSITSTLNLISHAEIIKEKSLLRQLIYTSSGIADMCIRDDRSVNDILDESEKLILSIASGVSEKEYFTSQELINKFVKKGDYLRNHKGETLGLSTGYQDLDKKINGLNKTDLIILAARPSMGKTAFSLNLLLNVAKNQKKVLFISLEMSAEQIFDRLMAVKTEIPLQKIINRNLEDSEWAYIGAASLEFANMDIKISNNTSSLFHVRNLARKLKNDDGLDLIVIDYLQLMSFTGKTDNKQQEVSEISRGLKRLAIELDIPIIALSQLSRAVESRADKRPMLSDLRESGAIEQDADIVSFLYRDDYYNPDSEDKGITELIIGKHRNGEIGTLKFLFIAPSTKFKPYTDMID